MAQAIDLHAPETNQLPSMTPLTPMAMLGRAVERGAGLDVLERLTVLAERWQATEARKAFDEAMAAAKGEIGPILKNREVDFTSPRGRTNYRYEDLAEIARSVDPVLRKHGLSYRFRTTSLPNEPVTVTCIVSHRLGHSEENTLIAGRDESGNKNSIQAIGSTVTYLQRYTLKAALGLAATTDDDGANSEPANTVSEPQIEQLQMLIVEVGADIPKFLRYFKIEHISDLPAERFADAVKMLEQKRGAA